MLLATHYMLHATCNTLHALDGISYFRVLIVNMQLTTETYKQTYRQHATCYMLHATCHMLHATCYMDWMAFHTSDYSL